VALLPPIPDRPDLPETWAEYLSRRAIVAMRRQFAEELASWLKDAPPFSVDEVVKSFGRFAAAYEFKPLSLSPCGRSSSMRCDLA